MNNSFKILIIDDEVQIRRLLRISFESNDFTVYEAKTAAEGVVECANRKPDLLILDLGLPDDSGINVLKKVREFTNIPVVILSVKNSEKDIIEALDAGADDYVTKPFNTGELLARVRVALRHINSVNNEPILKNGNITVDVSTRIVKQGKLECKLTSTEYSLLLLFLKNAGKVLTHQFILKEIWGMYYSDETQYLRIYISNLRKIFEKDPKNPKIFITEQGIGYRMILSE
jgi:two-component system, OmpR family, KDP operon response regulator KdpE